MQRGAILVPRFRDGEHAKRAQTHASNGMGLFWEIELTFVTAAGAMPAAAAAEPMETGEVAEEAAKRLAEASARLARLQDVFSGERRMRLSLREEGFSFLACMPGDEDLARELTDLPLVVFDGELRAGVLPDDGMQPIIYDAEADEDALHSLLLQVLDGGAAAAEMEHVRTDQRIRLVFENTLQSALLLFAPEKELAVHALPDSDFVAVCQTRNGEMHMHLYRRSDPLDAREEWVDANRLNSSAPCPVEVRQRVPFPPRCLQFVLNSDRCPPPLSTGERMESLIRPLSPELASGPPHLPAPVWSLPTLTRDEQRLSLPSTLNEGFPKRFYDVCDIVRRELVAERVRLDEKIRRWGEFATEYAEEIVVERERQRERMARLEREIDELEEELRLKGASFSRTPAACELRNQCTRARARAEATSRLQAGHPFQRSVFSMWEFMGERWVSANQPERRW